MLGLWKQNNLKINEKFQLGNLPKVCSQTTLNTIDQLEKKLNIMNEIK
jgi:hypothetical protein